VCEIWKQQSGLCAVTGRAFSSDHSGSLVEYPYSASLDRTDQARGCEIGNVRIVRRCINFARGQWPDEAFLYDGGRSKSGPVLDAADSLQESSLPITGHHSPQWRFR
jgi:hypothetical protein